ncbi:DUF6480 family protein [Streptomyces sp. ACA25]|uniref:DUF6480 family protein n=1 Tax=Streptomyces sp. ACA25 TaxID=3022596 RepID=UPI002307D54E|nr:DUF6480 family protein [Streptomyces sp. ACA25]MDB1086609.1 DUF6480 family protein [Streptomyces sp. ACA25]
MNEPTPDRPGPRRTRSDEPRPEDSAGSPRQGGPSTDPRPEHTPGLEPGGSVPPGETPPSEGGMSETGPQETHNPTRGWAALPLALILVVSAIFVAFFLTYALLILID